MSARIPGDFFQAVRRGVARPPGSTRHPFRQARPAARFRPVFGRNFRAEMPPGSWRKFSPVPGGNAARFRAELKGRIANKMQGLNGEFESAAHHCPPIHCLLVCAPVTLDTCHKMKSGTKYCMCPFDFVRVQLLMHQWSGYKDIVVVTAVY
jgi:hypothetical protein